jgi:hypothetical protein
MHHMTARTLLASAALSLLALTGCDQMDPMTRPYVWKPSGANADNISAMAADPHDLIVGRTQRGPRRSGSDVDAIDRLWTGKPVPLLSAGSGGSGAGGGGGGGGGGGSSAGGS